MARYIRKNKFIPEKEALVIFGQIIQGMSAMKDKKIIHRDLKPENIMFKDGKAKIVDFGLARKFEKGEFLKTFAGTPFNMAPEILKRNNYDPEKVDIYSAGTVLFEMLYGIHPFGGKSCEALLKKIEENEWNENKNIKISLRVKKLLKSMLDPNPSSRTDLSGI